MTMPRFMKTLVILFFLLTILFIILHILPAAITFGTTCYHLGMRLAVGYIVDHIMKNRADYTRKWFCSQSWERPLYKRLRVRTWKRWLPTYDPSLFDTEKHSLDEIVQATCQSEVVHEIIVLLSFLPLLGVIVFGDFPVFFVTSVLSAGFDLCFVIMQRYNRPRLVTLINKTKARNKI